MKFMLYSNDIYKIGYNDDMSVNKSSFEDYLDVRDDYSYNDYDEYLYDVSSELAEVFKNFLSTIKSNQQIVVLADLGLWDGRKSAFGFISPNDIFDEGIYNDTTFEWNGKDIVCTTHHHDGTNYYTYRILRDGKDSREFAEKLAAKKGKVSPQFINAWTRSFKAEIEKYYDN